MNHLEALTAEWLNYNGYFVRTAVKVGKRAKGGWARPGWTCSKRNPRCRQR
jgi:hypothetical protein